MQLLFLCTGNICRSPFAEHLVRRWAEELGGVEVLSAGTAAEAGRPCPPDAVQAASAFGVDLSLHRSRPLTFSMLDQADLIVTMGPDHRDTVVLMAPDTVARSVGLVEFAPGPARPREIPDPYRCEPWAFRACYTLMAVCLDRLWRSRVPGARGVRRPPFPLPAVD